MSHELRTLLNAIIGFSEGLLERTDRFPLADHQKDRRAESCASGDQLLTLINGVLDISKIESEKCSSTCSASGSRYSWTSCGASPRCC